VKPAYINRADADALAVFYEDDATDHQVAESPVKGREAIRRMFRGGFAAAEMIRIVGFFDVRRDQIVFQRGYWDKLSFLKAHGMPIPESGAGSLKSVVKILTKP
jgi:ketosteroid isomerase-like protein